MRKHGNVLAFVILTVSILAAVPDVLSGQESDATLLVDADHRVRMVYWDAGLFPVNGWEGWFTRHRTRAGVTWNPSPEFRVRAAFANEFFSWYRHRDKPDFTLDEIFFDNLYVQWRPETLPLAVTLGRQNMPLGEGFVVMDGSPLDGSRSIYFNALRADIHPAEDHRITLFAMHQPAQDDLLPRINDSDRRLFDTDKDGIGVYYTGLVASSSLSTYYLYAQQELPVRYQWLDQQPRVPAMTDNHLHTMGVRGAADIVPGLRLTAEGALQRGPDSRSSSGREQATLPRKAWAWYGYLTWTPASERPDMPIVRAGWYQYSGGVQYQDGRDRDWDPLFARWPKWSESFIYSLSQLRDGIAYTSNITAPWVEVRWQPVARVSLRTMLQRLGDHAGRTELLTPSAIGTLLIAEVKFQAMDRLSGHFLFERMWYDDGHPIIEADDYVWMRAELQYRWSDILVQ